jgi:hypothetical protein
MNAMDDVMLCYVLQRHRRPLFNKIAVFISGKYLDLLLILVTHCHAVNYLTKHHHHRHQ